VTDKINIITAERPNAAPARRQKSQKGVAAGTEFGYNIYAAGYARAADEGRRTVGFVAVTIKRKGLAMLAKTYWRLAVGVVAALGLCWAAGADVVVDDLEDNNNVNAFGQYWYSYQDGYATAITLTPSGDFTPTAGGAAGSSYAAALIFSGLGNAAGEGKFPEIAMGTPFVPTQTDGYGSDFNNVDSIAFWAKGPGGLKFYFNVHTVENAPDNNDNKYGKLITIAAGDANTWKRYSFSLKPVVAPSNVGQNIGETPSGRAGDLTQAPYYGKAYTFSPAKVTRLSWAIKKADNTSGTTTSPASGTFAVDSIKLIGSISAPATPPPSAGGVCDACVSATFGPSGTSVLLTDFTTNRNALGYYGYKYNNTGSTVTEGTDGHEGSGLSIDFTVGGTGNRYVGLGVSLSDDSVKTPLNANTFTGIYLEYKTTGLEAVKVEVVDKISVLNDDGKNYYINLPGTDGVWKSAAISFEALSAPSGVTTAFNQSELAKIQVATNVVGP